MDLNLPTFVRSMCISAITGKSRTHEVPKNGNCASKVSSTGGIHGYAVYHDIFKGFETLHIFTMRRSNWTILYKSIYQSGLVWVMDDLLHNYKCA